MVLSTKGPQGGQQYSSITQVQAKRFASTIAAAILIHAPGLWVKIQFEDAWQYINSILAAATEGWFLLLIVKWVCQTGTATNACIKSFCSTATSICSLAVSAMIGIFGSGFIILTILTDAVYRLLSGNDNPSVSQVIAGYENAKGHVVAQFVTDPVATGCYFMLGIGSFIGGLYIYLKDEWEQSSLVSVGLYQGAQKPKFRHIIILGLLCSILIQEGLYLPVVFAYFSIFILAQESYSPDGLANLSNTRRDSIGVGVKGGPNVIYIQHESLAGLMMNTQQGKAAMPFFQDRMHNDTDMYVFEHTRSVSGNTIDAMPALLIGCLPFTAKAIEYVQSLGRSIAHEFYRHGYHTGSFCSRTINQQVLTGPWKILYDLFTGGMKLVADPKSHSLPLTNIEATDDRNMLLCFSDWLLDLGNSTEKNELATPFYAQFYTFNTHYPYLMDKNDQGKGRYYSALRTEDKFLESMFNMLSNAGLLDNTIIIGSGDHGEHVIGKMYVRLQAYSPQVLTTASYIYYPSHLMRDNTIANRLRHNTQQLTSTLDLYPTIRSILHGGAPRNDTDNWINATNAQEGCMVGVDLAAVDIKDDRVVVASNSISSAGSPTHLWALMTKESALYHRMQNRPLKQLGQEKIGSYVMSFNDCVEGTNCLVGLNESSKNQFRHVIESFKNDSRIQDGVKDSGFVQFFESLVNS